MHYHQHHCQNTWCIIINTITGTHYTLSSIPLSEPMMHYHQHHYQNPWCIITNAIVRYQQHHYQKPWCIVINTIVRTHDASSTPLPEPMMHYHQQDYQNQWCITIKCGKLNGTWCHAGHLIINGTLKQKGHYCDHFTIIRNENIWQSQQWQICHHDERTLCFSDALKVATFWQHYWLPEIP